MIRLVAKLILMAGGLLLIARFVPGIEITSFYRALMVAIIWGIVSITLRPLLLLLTLPINILTLGLFSFVLNALLFWSLATFIAGFHVEGFVAALMGSFLLTFIAWISDIALKSK